KHPLTHEVAYRSQLTERRRRVHARVAEALADVGAGNLDESAALLAHHWEQAGDALQALRWHARAGEWLGAHAAVEAMRHWQAVRRLFREVPESLETLGLGTTACLWVLNLAWRVGLTEEEVAQVFAEGTALAERNGDLGARAGLLDAYGVALSVVAGRYRDGLAHVEEALALADKTGDLGQCVTLHFRLTYFHNIMGNPAEVLRVCERGMALAGGDIHLGADWTGFSPYLGLMCSRGLSLMLTGQLAEASAILARTEGLALEQGDLEVAAVAGWFHTDTAVCSGETSAALRLAARVVELGERIASPIYRVYGSWALSQALVEAGEWEEAVAAADGGLEILRRENRVVFL